MRRRAFIGWLGGAAAWSVARSLVSRAQAAMPVVGFLRPTSQASSVPFESGFRDGLKEAGFVDGKNVKIESRYTDNQLERLPELAAELIGLSPAVIAGSSLAALALKAATTTIPIVFGGGVDPVRDGLVPNLNRPGGNVTGVTFLAGQLGTKRLELLRQLVPHASIVGVLVNPNTSETEAERSDIKAAAQAIGLQLVIADIHSGRDIEPAFATFAEHKVQAILVGAGGLLTSNRNTIVALAARDRLPANYSVREFADAGGLMSYGTSIKDAYRQVGLYAGRILKGEKPGDLPVVQAAKFEFIINLKTAKALGLEFNPQLLATADEVIE